MTKYYDCQNSKGNYRIEGSKDNLAAFLAKSDMSRSIKVTSSDNSFELSTNGAMIDTCNNVSFLQQLQPLITQMQFGLVPKPELKLYSTQNNNLNNTNERRR